MDVMTQYTMKSVVVRIASANKILDENKKEFLEGVLTVLRLKGNKAKADEVSKLLKDL